MIAAHPDDEDSRLIAWLSRGRHVETAYLSLTRGDGGQNLIGDELGEALGVIRTEELLAARRIDGAHQYFGREFDFGFSKTAAETFTHWPHDSVLGDVVTVVRAFRPQVIVAVFTGTPADGHGHHQVSGIVAREAYDAAGDTVRFPVAKYGPAWVPSKFYRDKSYFGGGDSTLKIDVGGYDALLGESYSEIAALSRSQHKSQGMGQIARSGPATATLYREATRVNAATPRGAERSMFEGIDTTWSRLSPRLEGASMRASGAPIKAAVDSLRVLATRVQRSSWATDPASARPALVEMLRLIDGLAKSEGGDDVWTTAHIMRQRVTAALLAASGFEGRANTAHDVVAVGRDSAPVALSAGVTQSTWSDGPIVRAADTAVLVEDTTVTQPWWLAKPRNGDLFGTPVSRVAEDQRASGTLSVWAQLPGRTTVATTLPVLHRYGDPVKGEIDRPLAGVPALSVTLDGTVAYVPASTRIDRTVRVLLRSGLDAPQDATVALQLPLGLTVDSARHATIPAYGVRRVEFRITGMTPAGNGAITAMAQVGGRRYEVGYIPIEYDHIRAQRLYRDAVMALHAVDVVVPHSLTVAYIPGVGDNVVPALASLGVPVTVIDTAALLTADLSKYSTVVVGPRAYQASADVAAGARKLLDFARAGGTLVVQYGQSEMTEDGYMPYPITMARPAVRVTDEQAPVTVLDGQSPVLTSPNRIGPADWAGWVQERSLYMPSTADSHYHTVVSMKDPLESENPNGILLTPLGSGMYVYTTLSFFRQLPAGNPGAARLFVNLLAAHQ
jgi:LmbE family N-acetylglucosaminyl deacetylase